MKFVQERTSRMKKRIGSMLCATAILLGGVFVPGIRVQADGDSHTYTFNAGTGTQYTASARVNDPNGVSRKIAGWAFGSSTEDQSGVLCSRNTSQNTWGTSGGFALHDQDGIYWLKASTLYQIKFKYKVRSAQKPFTKDGVQYPAEGVYSTFSVQYSLKETEDSVDGGLSSGTLVATFAKIGNEANTFTAQEKAAGEFVTRNVGEWYTASYTFATPANFGSGARCDIGFYGTVWAGADIVIDNVTVSQAAGLILNPNGGEVGQAVLLGEIGDTISLPNAQKYGADFTGWYRDKACTQPFTDTVFTAENQKLTLYAGYSDTVFGFEGYKPAAEKFSFGNYFYEITQEKAYNGSHSVLYHYTPEYYERPYSDGSTYVSRRTQRENSISLKNVKANTQYVIQYRYFVKEGATANLRVFAATGAPNIWETDRYIRYEESVTVLPTAVATNQGCWKTGWMTFTTSETLSGKVLYFQIYAKTQANIEVFVDDITVHEVGNTAEITLNAGDGAFDNGKNECSVSAKQGDLLNDVLPTPAKSGYEFEGWCYNEECTDPVTTQEVDASLYLRTLYALWSRNCGFECYPYDYRGEHTSHPEWFFGSSCSLINDGTAQQGKIYARATYSAAEDANNRYNDLDRVISLNRLEMKQRYLVSFYYRMQEAGCDLKAEFYTITNNVWVIPQRRYYGGVTLKQENVGKGWVRVSMILTTDCVSESSNNLAVVIRSPQKADYTVDLDHFVFTKIEEDQGFALYTDEMQKDYQLRTLKIGETVPAEPRSLPGYRFVGWYRDAALSVPYTMDATTSEAGITLYAKWVKAEDFEAYPFDISGQNEKQSLYFPDTMEIAETPEAYSGTHVLRHTYLAENDPNSRSRSGLPDNCAPVCRVEDKTDYVVTFRYRVLEASTDFTVRLRTSMVNNVWGDGTNYPEVKKILAGEAGSGWQIATLEFTSSFSSSYFPMLYLVFNAVETADYTVEIDDVSVCKKESNMTVVTFPQESGICGGGKSVNAIGLPIDYPAVVTGENRVLYGYRDENGTFCSNGVHTAGTLSLRPYVAAQPVTRITFDDVDQNAVITENNAYKSELVTNTRYAGTHSLRMDHREDSKEAQYFPMVNADGNVKLENNAQYVATIRYLVRSSVDNITMYAVFATAEKENASANLKVASEKMKCVHVGSWQYARVTINTSYTGDAGYLYIRLTNGDLGELYVDSITLTRLDEGRRFVEFFDNRNNRYDSAVGNVGEQIQAPTMTGDENCEFKEWCRDETLSAPDAEMVYPQDLVSVRFARWKLKTIGFDNYLYSNYISTSKYAFGDDFEISSEEAVEGVSLKYTYHPADAYEQTSNNAAGLAFVDDHTTYRIDFSYKLKTARSDVKLKFLSANKANRWAFITDYDEATYTVYSGEVGDGWKRATVYLTTDFVNDSSIGLFLTVNQTELSECEIFFDNVDITDISSGWGVTAFLGQNGEAAFYTEGEIGQPVAPEIRIPKAQGASFTGWFTDPQCTVPYTGSTQQAGITYVYAGFDQGMEDFSGYTYESHDPAVFSPSVKIENGEAAFTAAQANETALLRFGTLENEVSYRVDFRYQTQTPGMRLNLVTADRMNAGELATRYEDEGTGYTVSEGEADGQWHTATVYLTTDFTARIADDENVEQDLSENASARFGNMLYLALCAPEAGSIRLDSVRVKAIDALYRDGSSVLTADAAEAAGNQAMRFYFSYESSNIVQMSVDGETYTLIERGIIFKNAINRKTGVAENGSVTVLPMTLQNAKRSGYALRSRTYGFSNFWDYDALAGRVVFSGYITGYTLRDARPTSAKGYVKLKNGSGRVITLYSADRAATVKAGVERVEGKTDKTEHTLAGVSFGRYTVVHPKIMPYIYGQKIEELVDYAASKGYSLTRTTDKAEETDYEILVGPTNRAQSEAVTGMGENEYVISVSGTKVVLLGGSDLATRAAVDEFLQILRSKDELSCGVDLVSGYEKTGLYVPSSANYRMTFHDEFDAPTVDESVWGWYADEKGTYSESLLGGKVYRTSVESEEVKTYTGKTVKPVFTRDGDLVLTSGRLENGTDFWSSQVSSYWKMIYQYGMLEFKVKVSEPPVSHALWMNGGGVERDGFRRLFGREERGSMTEYDLLENFAQNNRVASNVHYWWSAAKGILGHSSLDGVSAADARHFNYVPDSDETSIYDDYHVYTMFWENDGVSFAFDGVKYYRYQNDSTYFERMANYLIMGGGIAEPTYGVAYDPDVHGDYYETLTDWVRLYQVTDDGSVLRFAGQ